MAELVNEEQWSQVEEGTELLAEGDLDGARAFFERVVVDDTHNPYGFFFLGQVYFEMEEWKRALASYVKALDLSPDYLGAMLGAGHTLRQMGQMDQAIRMGKQALLKRADDPDALFFLGLCYLQSDEPAEAKRHFERFLESNPEFETAEEVRALLASMASNTDAT